MQLTRMGRNWPLAAGLLACLVLFAPDSAQALQVHDTPAEGLYAHQLAHIYYVVSLICFAGYVRRTDFTIRSWWYLRLFCLLMVLWNLLALFGHLAAAHVENTAIANGEDFLDIRLQLPWTLPKLLYFLARLDHLLCVPGLFCLYMAVRIFYQRAVAGMEVKKP